MQIKPAVSVLLRDIVRLRERVFVNPSFSQPLSRPRSSSVRGSKPANTPGTG
jgi:hypothetical protein